MTNRVHPFPSNLPPDQPARDQAASATGNYLVQAPAGSGKTTLLTERFLRLLATVEEPDQVLAITFTRAAVEEMRTRVINALQDAHKGKSAASPAQERILEAAAAALAHSDARGWNLLDEPQQLNIQTIDGLALQIAAKTPVTSRLGPGFAPTENAQIFYQRAAMRTLQKLEDLYSSDDDARQIAEAAATLLRHRDNRLQSCAELLADMLGSRDQWGRLFPLGRSLTDESMDSDIRPLLEGHLRTAVEAHLSHTLAQLVDSRLISRELLRLLQYAAANADEPISHCADLRELPPAQSEFLHHWRGIRAFVLTKEDAPRRSFTQREGFRNGAKDQKEAAKALAHTIGRNPGLLNALGGLRNLPPTEYTADEWRIAKTMFRLLQDAVLELKLLFAESGLVDFTEVNLAAIQALQSETAGDPSEPAFAFSGHYLHLLVDEFQDTSLTQQELLELLISDWTAGDGRTLFCVGDPMQSIYLFRQAEVRGFNRVKDDGLAAIKPELIQLTVNFRSQPLLIENHNRIFPEVFAGQEDVEFVPAQHFTGTPHDPAMVWHFYPAAERGSSPEEKLRPKEDEAAEVVRQIQDVLQNPANEIAVLVRAKNHARLIMKRLQEAGIPYRAIDMEPLSERQEVLDVFALTRALLHPADRVAWLSCLRAPWCGLGLEVLDSLVGMSENKTVAAILASSLEELSVGDQRRVRRVNAALQAASDRLGSARLPALLWDTWRQLGGEDCVSAEQYANVVSYFSMLETMDAEGTSFRSDTVQQAMEKLFAQPNPASDVRVEVLTIHKAKGREWDIVLVPQMERGTNKGSAAAVDWLEEGVSGTAWYLAPVAATGEDRSNLSEWIRNRKKQRENEEVRRLLYVAATRAKTTLHLLGAVARSGDGSLKNPATGTLLGAAWSYASSLPQLQLFGNSMDFSQPLSDLAIAAEAGKAVPPNKILRLPDRWFAERELSSPMKITTSPAKPAKNSGHTAILANVESRWMGTALHAMLEQAALRRARHESWEQIAAWAAGPTDFVRAQLIQAGMPMSRATKAAEHVRGLAMKAVASERGRWILESREGSLTEFGITTWEDGIARSVRLDRVFPGSAEPLQPGETHQWIVDYKSAAFSGNEVTEFLATQADAYAETMLEYAASLRAMTKDPRPIVCALYFPALDLIHKIATLD